MHICVDFTLKGALVKSQIKTQALNGEELTS